MIKFTYFYKRIQLLVGSPVVLAIIIIIIITIIIIIIIIIIIHLYSAFSTRFKGAVYKN